VLHRFGTQLSGVPSITCKAPVRLRGVGRRTHLGRLI